jgi:hypothetical protein
MKMSIVCLACVAGAWLLAATQHRAPPMPIPAEQGPGETSDFEQRRQEWMESMHAHAPSLDWRAMDASTRAQLREQRVVQTGSGRILAASVPPGTWHERGARNWAGRIGDVDYDAATDRLTAFAHGGQLWRSFRATLNWQPLNDAHRIGPDGNKQFLPLTGATERWLAADDTQHGFLYSDNQGATWSPSGGYVPFNWWYTSYLVSRDGDSGQIYALVVDYNFSDSAWEARLLVSADRGATFSDLGFVGTAEKSALLALRQSSGLVYLLVGNVLKRIEINNSLTTVATIAGAPAQASSDHVGLAGGITTGATPTPFLFAFVEAAGVTQVLRSLDAGSTWNLRGSVPITAYIRVAAGASRHDPNLAFYGGVNLYRSANGGQTFAAVNDWSQYYGNLSGKLHADISFVKSFADSGGNEVFFVGTDGGLFESTDGLLTVHNDNLSGMRQAQYYDSYTGRDPPYAISIGAQDQGYQRASRASSGIADYAQVISGDYAHLTSSDGGATLWMNYPGFTQIDPSPAGAAGVLPEWQFSGEGSLQNMLFLPPLLADPSNPRIAWLAGGASAANLYHVIRLTWNGVASYSGQVAHNEGTFDFAGPVTALAYSPQSPSTFFATAIAGNGASFFRTTTPLTAWTQTATALPRGQYFYGQAIVPDPARVNTLYVCGSGYSGPGVYVSTDNGSSFSPMNTGLPSTLVYSLAISPDGTNLFAATEVGPYYYDRTNSTWVDIGAGAPDNTYWNVDFVPALHVARFSTYGRGIWDYDLGGGDLIFRDGMD